MIKLLDSATIGTGIDSATFEVLSDGTVLDSQSFTDVTSADDFFAHNVFNFKLGSGPTDVELLFGAMMSGGEGFSFDYTIHGIDPAPSDTPLPPALPLFVGGLGALGLLGWRRKRKAQAVAN
jgi:hypothetical protein